jgi:hypothetical protein
VAIEICRYEPAWRSRWDSLVRESKNGTFLFVRDYMDYHQDRFCDHSVLVLDRGQVLGVLPANQAGDRIHSHQGLTYGGLITLPQMTTLRFLDVFSAVLGYFRGVGIRRLFYKTVPTIYHRLPAEEDRYALFLAGASLYRRDVLSVATAGSRGQVQARRRRGSLKAQKRGTIVEKSENWAGFWPLLTDNLLRRHGVRPVHDLTEIDRLRRRFPDNIHLHLARAAGQILAGAVIYESENVAHVQYMAASEAGREAGALDLLMLHLLDEVHPSKPFFDFGISNEQDGRLLNRGLVEQKEGFGARSFVHDHYELVLDGG